MLCLGADADFQPPVSTPKAAEILRRVTPGHPRLFLSGEGSDALRQAIANPGPLQEAWAKVRDAADRLLTEPPARYEIPDGLRLLSTSRMVLNRSYTLGLTYRLTGDRRYADRLALELDTVAAFRDWNPKHFLDTAEMTHAVAIGFDWLHEVWTPDQRARWQRAMVEFGLKLGVQSHGGDYRNGWWARSEHNWNQVCNGGIGIGALALATEESQLAGEFLEAALASIQRALRHYAPDGAWAEGPGYWNYATSYSVDFLAALESACGTDFGLSGLPGFAEAGTFPIYVTGPLGRTFNYADGGDNPIRTPAMLWLAAKFRRPAYAIYRRDHAGSPHPLDLVWSARAPAPDASTLPLSKHFRDAEVVTMRTAWNDRRALFVGFKAGDNKANHSNLDLGTFVLDALGHRWAVDLGADNYNLPGYFGGQRWTYYRMRAEGHNVVVLNPDQAPDQDPKAVARIQRFVQQPQRSFAVTDLSAAYARHARRVQRGIALENNRRVVVQDEIEVEAPLDLWWFMHTPAEIVLEDEGRVARLRQGEETFEARILAPAGAKFTVLPAAPLPTSPQPEKQNPNANIRKLALHLPATQRVTIVVSLTPIERSEKPSVIEATAFTPLSEW
jgi:hypothetical protein